MKQVGKRPYYQPSSIINRQAKALRVDNEVRVGTAGDNQNGHVIISKAMRFYNVRIQRCRATGYVTSGLITSDLV